MKKIALLLFSLSILGCGNKKNIETEAPEEAIAIEAEDQKNSYYDYADIDDVLALEVNDYDCWYFTSSIVKCEFDITNPNDRAVHELFVTYLPINESGEEGELGVSNTSGDNLVLETGKSGTISALLTTIPQGTKSLRFIIETNEKSYETNMEDFDVDSIGDN